jgi:hypothetical protein
MTGVLAVWEAAERPWEDIPGVVLVGVIMGIGLVIVAIRAMFGKKK